MFLGRGARFKLIMLRRGRAEDFVKFGLRQRYCIMNGLCIQNMPTTCTVKYNNCLCIHLKNVVLLLRSSKF